MKKGFEYIYVNGVRVTSHDVDNYDKVQNEKDQQDYIMIDGYWYLSKEQPERYEDYKGTEISKQPVIVTSQHPRKNTSTSTCSTRTLYVHNTCVPFNKYYLRKQKTNAKAPKAPQQNIATPADKPKQKKKLVVIKKDS